MTDEHDEKAREIANKRLSKLRKLDPSTVACVEADVATALRAAAAEGAGEWQDIATAPRDGVGK